MYRAKVKPENYRELLIALAAGSFQFIFYFIIPAFLIVKTGNLSGMKISFFPLFLFIYSFHLMRTVRGVDINDYMFTFERTFSRPIQIKKEDIKGIRIATEKEVFFFGWIMMNEKTITFSLKNHIMVINKKGRAFCFPVKRLNDFINECNLLGYYIEDSSGKRLKGEEDIMREISLKKRRASKEELAVVLGMLKEGAEWLRDRGIDYWQSWINPDGNYRGWIKQGVENGEFYIIENAEEIVGMYRLTYSDEMFWGKRDDVSGYIHSLTTRRKFYGYGIGKKILGMIERELKEKNIHKLRLDCGSNITGLCRYYKNEGFQEVGNIEVYGEKLTLFEKEI